MLVKLTFGVKDETLLRGLFFFLIFLVKSLSSTVFWFSVGTSFKFRNPLVEKLRFFFLFYKFNKHCHIVTII